MGGLLLERLLQRWCVDCPLRSQRGAEQYARMPHRVLIADPHALMRSKIRSLMERAGWEVVGEAANGQECIERVVALVPDLAILDLGMPVKDAIQVASELHKIHLSTKLLVYTIHDSDVIREEVLRAGIDGIAAKSGSAAELLSEAARLAG
jgi:DNA-binding NarL/FixJ family response regulator